jgi:hypothetical protein
MSSFFWPMIDESTSALTAAVNDLFQKKSKLNRFEFLSPPIIFVASLQQKLYQFGGNRIAVLFTTIYRKANDCGIRKL